MILHSLIIFQFLFSSLNCTQLIHKKYPANKVIFLVKTLSFVFYEQNDKIKIFTNKSKLT